MKSFTSPTLCPAVQGVVFEFSHAGRPLSGLVLSNALVDVFGSHDDGHAWLKCFERHQDEVVACARDRWLKNPTGSVVVVRTDDLAGQEADTDA